jgi:hypothetical protein
MKSIYFKVILSESKLGLAKENPAGGRRKPRQYPRISVATYRRRRKPH